MIPFSVFAQQYGDDCVDRAKLMLANISSQDYYKRSTPHAYCLRCCRLVICDLCIVTWSEGYGKLVDTRNYSPRILPLCPCCNERTVPNRDVTRTSGEPHELDTNLQTSDNPLFSLADLIAEDENCKGEGSICGRFISVLHKMYPVRSYSRHISNLMIKKLLGRVFVLPERGKKL